MFRYFFRGTVKYRVSSENVSLLINELKSEVALRNVKTREGELLFECFYDEKNKTSKILEKRNAKVEHERCFGMPHLLGKYKRRVGLLAGALTVFVLLLLSQLFVWHISIEGNENVGEDEIKSVLYSIGFKEGAYKKGVDMDSLVNNFLIREKRISWIAVNFDGTVAHVEVKEGANPSLSPKKENVNLVASTAGIILRVDALEGGTLVEKGDAVVKGQLLISAFVEKRTGGTVLRGARGFVWANTERGYQVSVPLEYCEKSYTGRKMKTFSLSVLGKKLEIDTGFFIKDGTFEKRKAVGGESTIVNSVLPFTVKSDEYFEYTSIKNRRTKKEALEIAREQCQERLASDSPGFKTIKKNESFKINDGCLLYECKFYGVENIASELEFDLS